MLATIINEEVENHLSKAIVEELGKENLRPRIRTNGSDDFYFYTLLRLYIKATMLALGEDVKPDLHNSLITFNKSSLINEVNILTNICLDLCNVKEKRI